MRKNVKAETANAEHCTVIFHDSAKLGALIILFRCVDSERNNQQRVVRLEVLPKSLNGQELARELLRCLSTELQNDEKKL